MNKYTIALLLLNCLTLSQLQAAEHGEDDPNLPQHHDWDDAAPDVDEPPSPILASSLGGAAPLAENEEEAIQVAPAALEAEEAAPAAAFPNVEQDEPSSEDEPSSPEPVITSDEDEAEDSQG